MPSPWWLGLPKNIPHWTDGGAKPQGIAILGRLFGSDEPAHTTVQEALKCFASLSRNYTKPHQGWHSLPDGQFIPPLPTFASECISIHERLTQKTVAAPVHTALDNPAWLLPPANVEDWTQRYAKPEGTRYAQKLLRADRGTSGDEIFNTTWIYFQEESKGFGHDPFLGEKHVTSTKPDRQRLAWQRLSNASLVPSRPEFFYRIWVSITRHKRTERRHSRDIENGLICDLLVDLDQWLDLKECWKLAPEPGKTYLWHQHINNMRLAEIANTYGATVDHVKQRSVLARASLRACLLGKNVSRGPDGH